MADDKKNHWSFLANLLGAEGAAPEPVAPSPVSDSDETKAGTTVTPPLPSADKPKPPVKKSTPGWGDLARSFGLSIDSAPSKEEVAAPEEPVTEVSPTPEPQPAASDELGWSLDAETLPPVLPGFGTPKSRVPHANTPTQRSIAQPDKSVDKLSGGQEASSLDSFGGEPRQLESTPAAKASGRAEHDSSSRQPADSLDDEDRPRRRNRRGRGNRNQAETEVRRNLDDARSRRDDRESESETSSRSEFDFEPSSRDDDEGDDDRRPRRRRRRRRRRGEDSETVRASEAGESDADTNTEKKSFESEENASESGEGRSRRRRRGRKRSGESQKQGAEAYDESSLDSDFEPTDFGFADDDGGQDRQPARSSGHDATPSEDDSIDEREDAIGERQGRRQNFTSWSEAIGHVIDRNLATRSDSSGGRGNARRGRSGRGGRRPDN